MHEIIIIFVRTLSLYIGFTVVIDAPNYLYTLYLSNNSVGGLWWGIASVSVPIIYHIALAWIVWLLAPYISRVASRKYNANISFNINAMLSVGLVIMGASYVFEKSLLLIKYVVSSIALLKNSTNDGVIMKGEHSLAKLLISPLPITTLISFIIILMFFINYQKLEKAIIAHIK